jgi:hypothetical protein
VLWLLAARGGSAAGSDQGSGPPGVA